MPSTVNVWDEKSERYVGVPGISRYLTEAEKTEMMEKATRGVPVKQDYEHARPGVAMRGENYVYGESGTALGGQGNHSNSWGFAQGRGNVVSGPTGVAIGRSNLASANTSIAIGRDSESTDYAGVVIGSDNAARAPFSYAIGNSAIVEDENQVVLGRCNAPSPGSVLVIGAGDLNRQNALSVKADGSVSYGGSLVDGELELDVDTYSSYETILPQGETEWTPSTRPDTNTYLNGNGSGRTVKKIEVDGVEYVCLKLNMNQGIGGNATTVLRDNATAKSVQAIADSTIRVDAWVYLDTDIDHIVKFRVGRTSDLGLGIGTPSYYMPGYGEEGMQEYPVNISHRQWTLVSIPSRLAGSFTGTQYVTLSAYTDTSSLSNPQQLYILNTIVSSADASIPYMGDTAGDFYTMVKVADVQSLSERVHDWLLDNRVITMDTGNHTIVAGDITNTTSGYVCAVNGKPALEVILYNPQTKYNDRYRTMDCYRRGIYIAPWVKSVSYKRFVENEPVLRV